MREIWDVVRGGGCKCLQFPSEGFVVFVEELKCSCFESRIILDSIQWSIIDTDLY